MITWSMKTREDGKWQARRHSDIKGLKIREVLRQAEGSETVAELELPTIGKCYLCGTDALKRLMSTRGKKAVTCEAGIKLIDAVHPGLLDTADAVYQGPDDAIQLELAT